MEYFLPLASILLLLTDAAHAAGLRRLKNDPKDETVQWENGHWKDEAAPSESLNLNDRFDSASTSPSTPDSDTPSQVPTMAPSKIEGATISQAPSVPLAPSASPSKLPVTYETYSGSEMTGKSFRIEITFDNNPQQNGWHVFKGIGSSKSEIFAKDFGTIQSRGKIITTFEDIEAGAYTFVIADINADGIDEGKVSLYVGDDDILLWERDGDFGFLIEKAFIIE